MSFLTRNEEWGKHGWADTALRPSRRCYVHVQENSNGMLLLFVEWELDAS